MKEIGRRILIKALARRVSTWHPADAQFFEKNLLLNSHDPLKIMFSRKVPLAGLSTLPDNLGVSRF